MGLLIATHLAMSARPFRTTVIDRVTNPVFMAYSLISPVTLAQAIQAFLAAPVVEMFIPETALKHKSLSLMILATSSINDVYGKLGTLCRKPSINSSTCCKSIPILSKRSRST